MPIYKSKNEDFFKMWSPQMAYVLGFFAADGTMYKTKRGTHFIEFQITDRNLLEKIRETLGSDHKISLRQGRNNRQKTVYRFQVGSKTIFEDLAELGFTQAKSKTLKMPPVPTQFFSHFLRGYFDGDGNVTVGEYKRYYRKNKSRIIISGFACGSASFLKVVHEKVKNMSKVRGGTFYYHDGAYRLCFSVRDSVALYDFIYRDVMDNPFLSRKKEIFENYFRVARAK